ncbi:hypothetical protein ABZX40_28825 [Streptomyces sp. NPDC004610]|uniref:hypothetical protein n=1 Tax=unclassified Streptomyces TaxID=2593676 RepID=UPI0033A11EF4
MRERPEVVQEPDSGEGVRKRRLDLSVPQVAGSAIAAVLAAKLASSFGVYGTILGAGLVSVVATCGGSVFQHFFTRTGEQFRDTPTTAPPAPAATGVTAHDPPPWEPPASGGFTEGTVYRARARAPRKRTWKRPLLAAVLVFGVTMGGITAYELTSGENFSGGGGTTVGDAFTGETKSSTTPGDSVPGDDSGTTTPAPGTSGDPAAPNDGSSPAPTPSAPEDDPGASTPPGSGAPDGTDTPSGTPGSGTGTPDPAVPSAPATPPAPSADSRSGTGAPGQGGPATP